MCHTFLLSYIEVGALYIEFNTGPPDMAGKGDGGAIGVQVGLTNSVSNVV